MPCIILESKFGVRLIPQDTRYNLMDGEVVKGVSWDCNATSQHQVEEELSKAGLQIGDAIAWVTKKLGIEKCAPCAARQEILNHVSELGWKETIRQLKETIKHE